MNEYLNRVDSGRRAAASNSAIHSARMVRWSSLGMRSLRTVDSWTVIALFCLRFGPFRRRLQRPMRNVIRVVNHFTGRLQFIAAQLGLLKRRSVRRQPEFL